MHTDEYQISLNREIGVCRGKIASAQKSLLGFELVYGIKTEQFLDSGSNDTVVPTKDDVRWKEAAAALAIWSKRLAEYEALYSSMKK
ncbi:MAG TPA: hypothetical protein VK448_02745 [Dissulfurispiraceae bacterium]|nr:hypothetical protein [Dissulfurispiraceae bacterium]